MPVPVAEVEVAEDEPAAEVESEVESSPMLEYFEEVRQELDEARQRLSEETGNEATAEAVV